MEEFDYEPLERESQEQGAKIRSHSDEDTVSEGECSEDSDSDRSSLEDGRPPAKVRLVKPLVPPAKKPFSGWKDVAEESVLTETVNKVEVEEEENKPPISRGVEDYSKDFNNLRQVLKPGVSPLQSSLDDIIVINRIKKPLECHASDQIKISTCDTNEDIVKDVSAKLLEPNTELMRRTVELMGAQVVFDIFEKTREVEAEGGLMTADGFRRRNSGGVFFLLLREDKNLPQNLVKQLFREEQRSKSRINRKRKRAKQKKAVQRKQLKLVEAAAMDDLPSRKEVFLKDVSNGQGNVESSMDLNESIEEKVDGHQDGQGHSSKPDQEVEEYEEDVLYVSLDEDDLSD
ncbi:unnamed protein product [Darwinula stevensoni]|uniref:Phosphorylated adapter RNA export protein n=1 Tax=Darwinula stevensoni TaxID=69355 RepID=A0A7R9AHD0_9CRUS|nr:unnamed protein product [Darwinula stevensoni]CAG0904284.1 unnamed protein product [Darwinula stevensoni]